MKSFILSLFLLLFTYSVNAQVGIGTTTPYGALDITSTTDGLLIPRVALTSTTTVTVLTGTTSELVYNTATTGDVTPGFYYLSTATGPWVKLASSASTDWSITGNTGITSSNFIGTTNANDADVIFRRYGVLAGKLRASSTSFGLNTLTVAPSSNNNAAFGNGALKLSTGLNNVAVGTNALTANTTGTDNVAVGTNALPASSTTSFNVAIGGNALQASTGSNNVAVGYNSLQSCASTAQWNTAVGTNALRGISDAAAQYNTALGYNAMATGTGNFSYCVAIGSLALQGNTGIYNVGLGHSAGSAMTNGYNNIAIGYNAQVPTAAGNNQVRIGDGFSAYYGVQVAWTVTSDKRWKGNIKDSALGLDFINKLRPVSYTRNNDEKGKTEYGFIAQDLEKAFIDAGDANNGVISKDDNGMMGVRYNDFIPITVKAVQEQQLQIEELKKKNEELMKINAAILKRLEALEKGQ